MSLELVEGAVDAVYDYLVANMAAKLDVIDARYGDGITLEDIRSWHKAEPTAEVITPSILVLGLGSRPGVEGDDWLEIAHRVLVAIIYTNPNTDTLRKALYRYVLACTELVRALRASSGYAGTLESMDYSEIYGRGDEYLADARLIVQLAKFES